jgi:adenylate kinase family enzyme
LTDAPAHAGTARGGKRTQATRLARHFGIEHVVRHRLDVFDALIGPLIDYYRVRGILVTVDGGLPVDGVTGSILEHLGAAVAGSD